MRARDPSHTVDIDVLHLVPRPVRPDELPELRAIWWHQVALGHRLPAELGVIVIEGGSAAIRRRWPAVEEQGP